MAIPGRRQTANGQVADRTPMTGGVSATINLWQCGPCGPVILAPFPTATNIHNLRHSLSNWLVNKAKIEPKTVQGILIHRRRSISTRRNTATKREPRRERFSMPWG